jgi:deoxyribonuclease-4
MTKQLLGAHTSIQGGVSKAVELADKLGFTAMQIFTKNNSRWDSNRISDNEVEQYKTKLSQSKIKSVLAHSSYLINLCSANAEIRKKSLSSFIEELERCEQLGIEYLNFHPGAHGGQGTDEAIKIIAEALNTATSKTKNAGCMLELTAGQGTSIGHSFEELAGIIDLVENKKRMAVCIDTAHIFAAGYDISKKESYEKTFEDFDAVVGLKYLKYFHLNDSKKPLGSRVDRHEHIGKGFIGLEGFRLILNDKRFENIPKVLETPKGKECLEDLENLKVLRSLIKEKR